MSKIDLLKHTTEVTRIDCSLCNRVETVQDAAEQAIDEFHKLGWKVKKGSCVCPSCAKKDSGVGSAPYKFPLTDHIIPKSFVKDLRK